MKIKCICDSCLKKCKITRGGDWCSSYVDSNDYFKELFIGKAVIKDGKLIYIDEKEINIDVILLNLILSDEPSREHFLNKIDETKTMLADLINTLQVGDRQEERNQRYNQAISDAVKMIKGE